MLNRRSRRSMSQINVVPYIDVMLVLLVIFMVTTPMFSPGVVNLPSVGKAAQVDREPIQVVIDATGQFSVSEKGEQEAVASLGALSEALARRTGGDIGRPVVVSADKTIAYEKVMDAMRQLQKDGYTHIGLLVKTEQAALAVATVA